MGGDNGSKLPEPDLTELEKKKKAFEANPDNFIDINELVLAVKRTDNKVETLIGSSSRTELEISLIRITHQCFGVFNAMSHAQQQASNPKIVKPKGSIIDFVRGGKK